MGRVRTLLRTLLLGRPLGLRARIWAKLRRTRPDAPRTAPPTPAAPVREAPPAGWVDVATVEEADEAEVLEVMVDGRPVAVGRIDGAWFAVDATCPHAGGPLSDGELDETELTCPYHGWSFDVRTGTCAVDDALQLPVHRVQERDGRLWVSVVVD